MASFAQQDFADMAVELISECGRPATLIRQGLNAAPDTTKPYRDRAIVPTEETITLAFLDYSRGHEFSTRVTESRRTAYLAADTLTGAAPRPKDLIRDADPEDPDATRTWAIEMVDDVRPGTVRVYYELKLVRQ